MSGERQQPRSAERSVEQGQARQILVVDDDTLVRTFMQDYLTELGCAVVTAGDGRQAIDTFQRLQASICLLITDLRMPEMDGVSLIRWVRGIDKELPIIVITGHADHSTLQAIRQDVTMMIEKPVRASELQKLPGLMRRP